MKRLYSYRFSTVYFETTAYTLRASHFVYEKDSIMNIRQNWINLSFVYFHHIAHIFYIHYVKIGIGKDLYRNGSSILPAD